MHVHFYRHDKITESFRYTQYVSCVESKKLVGEYDDRSIERERVYQNLFVLIHPPYIGSGKAGFVMSKHDLVSATVDTKDHYSVQARQVGGL